MTVAAQVPEYTTDVVYPSAFGAFQAPVHLSYAAALGGRRGPRLDRPFRYADLGTGAGLTLCVLADCHPESEFHGVDLNPDHVAAARDLAARAGLTNVMFHQADFADLDKLDLGTVDFVGLSGIYSWLTPALRAAVLDWTGRALQPDGLVFLHYGALPGNAQVDALYALIREVARDRPGDSLARFTAAVAQLRRLADSNAAFFRNNPYAAAWIKGLADQDQRSMAHEVLNAQPASLSARDAADEAAAHGLLFVANAQLELNHMALIAPDALRDDLEATTPIAREMMVDAIRNAHSRMDVLARPGEPVGFAAAAGDLLLDRLDRGAADAERAHLAKATGVDFRLPIHGALLGELNGGAKRVATLLDSDRLAAWPVAERIAALQHLVAAKLIHVLRWPYADSVPAGPVRLTSTLNRLLLEERIESAGTLPLASRIAGTQVMLPPADRLALMALVGGDFEAAWARIGKAGQRVTHAGRPVADAGGLAAVAQTRAAAVGPAMVRHLARLGIVGTAP